MPPFPGFPDDRERLRLSQLPLVTSNELRLSGLLTAPLLFYGAWSLWHSGHPLGALACGAGASAVLGVAARAKEAACPRCGAGIRPVAGPARCMECAAFGYFKEDGARLVPVTPGSLDSGLGFFVLPADLGGKPLALPWDGGCCVCAAPADGRRDVQFGTQVSGIPGVAGTVEVIRFKVPVCPGHTSGARSAAGGVSFQSYDYWLDFVKLNGRPG